MPAMDSTFSQWLIARGYDAQQWTPELLRRQYEAETRTQITDQPQRLVQDLRGCHWPARVYRCEVPL